MEKNLDTYAGVIARALQHQLGGTHRAVKTVMQWTGAGERTVKNWFAGSSGPSGRHLVALARHSDEVMAMFLALAGRQQITVTVKLVDVRNRIATLLEEIDVLMRYEESQQ